MDPVSGFPLILFLGALAFIAGRFSSMVGFGKKDRCTIDLNGEELSAQGILDALLIVDPRKGRVLFANRRAADFYGKKASELEGKKYAEFLGKDSAEGLPIIPGQNFQETHFDAEGKELYVEVTSTFIRYRMRHAILVAIRSIQDQSENVKASEVRKAAINATYNGIGIVRKDEKGWLLVDANPALISTLEMPRDQVIGTPFFELLPDQERQEKIRKNISKGEGWKGEIQIDDGRGERWLIMSIDPMKGEVEEEGGHFFAVVCQDITQRRVAENRLVDAIVRTQQQERKRMANDLHDGVGQTLTAANVYLKSMEKKWKKGEPERGMEHLPMISDLINKGVEDIRNISHDLMPDTLKEYGLIRALRQMVHEADEASEGASIIFHTAADPEKRWDEQVEGAMYRIGQEILNNTLRHAEASQFICHLTERNGTLILEAEDDGKGFDLSGINGKDGAGLKGLKERARSVGGDIEIRSQPGQGAYFKVNIPSASKERTWEKNTRSA